MRMILALDLDRLIGRADGTLPWKLPGDLKRFKNLTMGGTLIVGRKTAETLPKLPGRTVMVASRTSKLALASSRVWPIADGTQGDLADLCTAHPDAWIAGGGEIYRAALELGVVTEVYATRVMSFANYQSEEDVFAPHWEEDFTLKSVELGRDNTTHELWRRK